jgi:hypothetical protein
MHLRLINTPHYITRTHLRPYDVVISEFLIPLRDEVGFLEFELVDAGDFSVASSLLASL